MENNQETKIIETSAVVIEEEKRENVFKSAFKATSDFFKKFKSGKIKNQLLLKRGGYSLAITAIVLVGLIVFNLLVGALANRFNLEFDMTSNKKNSMSEENVEFIKNLDADVNVTVCGTEDDYAEYMQYYAQNYHNVTINSYAEFEYFLQTVNLIEKYPSYNDKIVVKYVDPQSTEFTAITSTYANYDLSYGDIIVTCNTKNGERVKVLHFDDIYVVTEDSSYAAYYGYPLYTLTANRLETALTSAISYVSSADTKKVAMLSGHSNNNYTDAYKALLTLNNYDITEISDKLVTSISNDFDAIIIAAPSVDFIGSELDVISAFLDNDGKLGKGLIFFADATCPAMPNLYSFLKQWGIEITEGILFETDSNYQVAGPSTIGSFPVEIKDDNITEEMLNMYAITNYNVPMKVCDASSYERQATALLQTTQTNVIAPLGADDAWAEYTNTDKQLFDTVIQSVESDHDSDNNLLTSYVMAFSSVEFVQSTWASYNQLCNQNIVMAATDRAAHVGDTSMTFTSKVIENESFADKITAESVKVINAIFMFIIPIIVIILGIVIFTRRRNAR